MLPASILGSISFNVVVLLCLSVRYPTPCPGTNAIVKVGSKAGDLESLVRPVHQQPVTLHNNRRNQICIPLEAPEAKNAPVTQSVSRPASPFGIKKYFRVGDQLGLGQLRHKTTLYICIYYTDYSGLIAQTVC